MGTLKVHSQSFYFQVQGMIYLASSVYVVNIVCPAILLITKQEDLLYLPCCPNNWKTSLDLHIIIQLLSLQLIF